MSDRRLRVLLVDDHPLLRRGLGELLEGHGLELAGEAPDGRRGVRLALELRPDVVVMDLAMPVMGGVEATRRLAEADPSIPVLVLTASATEPDVVEALLAGARGFLLKDAPVEELLAGIRAAAAGDGFLAPSVAGRLIARVRAGATAERDAPPERAERLTPRERDVLRLLARGHDNREIAARLFLGDGTVRRHVSSIFAKLGVDNRVRAAVYAARHGLDRDPDTPRETS